MRPLRDGVIADYFVTQGMLEYFITKVAYRIPLRKPSVMISVPYGVTKVERRGVREAALVAVRPRSSSSPNRWPRPSAPGCPWARPPATWSSTSAAAPPRMLVVAMKGIVAAESVRVGGVHLDDAIISYVRKKYNLVIGEPTAEAIKIKIGAAEELDERLEDAACKGATRKPGCRAPSP